MTTLALPTAIRIGPEELPKHTLGWQILGWTKEYLLQPDGPDAGQPWTFTPEQARFVLNWYAIDGRSRFVYRYGMLRRMKGWGKDPVAAALSCVEFIGPCRFERWVDGEPVAQPHYSAWIQIAAVSREQPLALETRVATTGGWKTIGELVIGDHVFDEGGKVQPVARETDVLHGLPCYRITFDDGQSVVASGSHGWTVERKRLRGDYHIGELLTTEAMAAGYLDSKGGKRIRIPAVGRETTDIDLAIDPYLLGLWLGDGNRCNGSIAFDARSKPEYAANLASVLQPHEELVFSRQAGNSATVNIVRKGKLCPRGHEKRVDPVYSNGYPACRKCRQNRQRKDREPDSILASFIERLRDGGLLRNKHIPLRYLWAGTGQRRALLQGLIDSDGNVMGSGRVRFTNTNRYLIDGFQSLAIGLGYKCTVRARSNNAWIAEFRAGVESVSQLAAKRERQFAMSKPQSQYRYVVSVERVESVPVKCIGLDTVRHLFQVEGGILTKNTRNTMTLFPGMLSPKAIEEFGIDLGKEIIYANHGRCRIEAVTSSPRALEGGRATFSIKNESMHWLAPNEGHEMAKVIARNAAKSRDGSSRVLAISNAHAPGEDSDAEHDHEAWRKIDQGLSAATGLLYDCLEAPETDLEDEDSLRAGIMAARGESWWIDVDRLVAEIGDPRTSPAMARRFYLNQIVAEEDKPFDAKRWEELARRGYVVPDGALIVLGFDGSISNDDTALIGTEVATGHQWVVGYWKPEIIDSGEVRIPFMEVDETVDAAFGRWKVWRFNADPYYWKDMLAAWAGRYGEVVVSWPTTLYRKMAASLLAYRNAIETGALTHDGDARFAAGMYNAHKHMRQFTDDQGERMWTIQKERPDSPLKIDAVMAGCLSWEAHTAAIAAGETGGQEEEAGVMFV